MKKRKKQNNKDNNSGDKDKDDKEKKAKKAKANKKFWDGQRQKIESGNKEAIEKRDKYNAERRKKARLLKETIENIKAKDAHESDDDSYNPYSHLTDEQKMLVEKVEEDKRKRSVRDKLRYQKLKADQAKNKKNENNSKRKLQPKSRLRKKSKSVLKKKKASKMSNKSKQGHNKFIAGASGGDGGNGDDDDDDNDDDDYDFDDNEYTADDDVNNNDEMNEMNKSNDDEAVLKLFNEKREIKLSKDQQQLYIEKVDQLKEKREFDPNGYESFNSNVHLTNEETKFLHYHNFYNYCEEGDKIESYKPFSYELNRHKKLRDKFRNELFPSTSDDTNENDELPAFEDIYEEDQEYIHHENWNKFSMIHSTAKDPFNFHVYNASHRLVQGGKIHKYGTEVTIKFPRNSTYFIIFHGRLVHFGSEAIIGGNRFNKKYLKSTRLFSYLRVPEEHSSNRGERYEKRVRGYKNEIPENTVDSNSFEFTCNNIRKCKKCKKSLDDRMLTIELGKYNNVNRDIDGVTHVIGDMDRDGWEIYEGIDISSKFQDEMQDLIENYGKRFVGIGVNVNRKSLKMHDLDSLKHPKIGKMKSIYDAFNDIHRKLRQIPYFKNVKMDSKTILANFGHCDNQEPHRDYSSLRVENEVQYQENMDEDDNNDQENSNE